jgi:hypothetical protein
MKSVFHVPKVRGRRRVRYNQQAAVHTIMLTDNIAELYETEYLYHCVTFIVL